MESKEELNKIKRVLAPTALSILYLFYEDPELITNLTGIDQKITSSYPSIRRGVKPLIALGICNKLTVGSGSWVIRLNNESELTKHIFKLFKVILKRADK